jgi:tRNA ligase
LQLRYVPVLQPLKKFSPHHHPQLCDDNFEEHVLPYSADKTGLHLHGINDCARHFRTQPPAVLDAFAREWGFIPTPSFELPSVQEVRTFTDEVGRSGKWNGEALEGFVVRTTVRGAAVADASPPPYSEGSSFFFKVKFDEPYMMYRDWREITKALVTRGEGAKLPKSKMARPETKVYVKWVREEIKARPALFDGYTKGHGIIATRERFLRWLETAEGGKGKVESDEEVVAASEKKFGKTIIMPIAVPGLGALHSPYANGDAERRIKEKQPLPWLLRNCSNLDTHKATMFGSKRRRPLLFKMSRSSCKVMTLS